MNPIHTGYRALWAAWTVAALAAEFYVPGLWGPVVLAFVALEGIAVVRQGKGDTLSENKWALAAGKRWRYYGMPFVNAWLCFHLYQFGTVAPGLGRLFLVLGLWVWLLGHDWYMGKEG